MSEESPGLSPEHHGLLNNQKTNEGDFISMRDLYADDPLALEQIDVYAPKTPWKQIYREYADALVGDDINSLRKVLEEFRSVYPLLFARLIESIPADEREGDLTYRAMLLMEDHIE